MELLLKTATPRNLALALLLFGLFKAGERYGGRAVSAYGAWRYPPQAAAPTPDGAEIMARKEERESRAVARRYLSVVESLRRASAAGLETARFEAKASAALKLNTPAYRAYALKALAEVERDMPLLGAAGRPAPVVEDEPEVPPDVPARKIKRGRK